MNFLELCQRLRQEAGISGTGPSAVTNQTGELKRVVDWVASAYETIQRLHETWDFLRADFSFITAASTQEYTPAAASLTEHKSWKMDSLRCYLTSAGVTDETWLTEMPWEAFRDARMFGANRSVAGRPIEAAERPSNSALLFFPVPDAVYTVTGEYWKRPQVMSANSDEPLFDRDYHMVIVWQALMDYATYENAPELYARGRSGYLSIIGKMERQYLPEMELGEPLA